jgi:membrane-bound lytic murein transglycosylase A
MSGLVPAIHVFTLAAVDNEAIRRSQVSFAALEGWREDDHEAAFHALLKSCRKASSPDAVCAAAIARGDGVGRETARAFFETHYTPHAVHGAGQQGIVTGYYEPEVRGSRERDDAFQVPVYGRPHDLIMLTPDTERARFNDRITGVRETREGQVPYYTRREIDAGALSDRRLEILYLDDPVELFYMQVQGSGLVRLRDGAAVRLTYAAKNGHPYTSIGKLLIERREIEREGMRMRAVKAWLHADPARGPALLAENKSYVFFRELDAEEGRDGPLGVEGVALTPGRSLAVDASYHRLGLPVFVTVPDLIVEGASFRRLMIAQDVGSAIRGPERGDLFWGTGEAAGAIAGSTNHKARFHVLLPKR